MDFLKKYKLPFPFLSSDEIIKSETVFSQAMMSDATFAKNFREWFSFYDQNKDKMHIYDVDGGWAAAMALALEKVYAHLEFTMAQLFESKSAEELYDMFPMPGVPKAKVLKFIDYARYTYWNNHRKIGSRFDYAISPGGDLFVYELNADTPSMLFESMNVQNLMADALGDTEAQFNEIWEMSKGDPSVRRDSVTAVCAYNAEGEDFGTVESIAQLMENAGGAVYLTTINDLAFDPKETERSPFFLHCMPHLELDNIYAMLPWEEMIHGGMDIIDNWEVWKDKVRFFEPAWAWFLSHKGLFTYMSEGQTLEFKGHDMDTGETVSAYVSASGTPQAYDLKEGIVSKPALGRKSSAIRIHQETDGKKTMVQSADKTYEEGPYVYQPLRPTFKNEDGTRVMGTMWMYGSTAACMSFREFDGAILENVNERVIMHRLV